MLQTTVGKEEAKHMDITLIRYGSNFDTYRDYPQLHVYRVAQYHVYSDLIVKVRFKSPNCCY